MKSSIRNTWDRLSPRGKQIIAIAGAIGAVMICVAIFQPGDNERKVRNNPKTDQVRNVLTDRSNRGDQIDALAGSLSRQNDEIERLYKEIESVKNRDRKTEIRQQQELKTEIEKLRQELQQIKTEGIGPATSDSLFKQESTLDGGDHSQQGEVGDSNTKSARKMRVSIITQAKKKDEKKSEKKAKSDSVAYIPAGSIITGTIITGGDFPTSKGGFENPTPLLIRISKEAILPNRYTSDIRECFLLTGGRGDLASERVKLRGEMLSCIRTDGSVIETKLNSYVSGEDGKEGVKGRLVSKQGQIIARSLVAGFASGLSEAFDVNQVPTITTSSDGTVQYEKVYNGDALQGAAVKGFSNAMERISDFYLDMAKDIFPVVEINAGRQVDVIVISGTQLKVSAEGAFAQPQIMR